MYACAECGAPVELVNKEFEEPVFVRSCAHKNAPITASLAATVYGEGKAE